MTPSDSTLLSPAVLAGRLREIAVFHDMEEKDLVWLAERMEAAHLQPGDIITTEGSPADHMLVIFDGAIRAQKEHGAGDGRTYSAGAGQITGMLPYSRLTHFPLTSRAMTPTTIATLHVSHFPEMLNRMPALGSRLVSVMADRIRETTKADQQRDRLMALGKLSAGLAHELNNPAAAVRSAAMSLKEAVHNLRSAQLHLDKRDISREQRVFLARLECDWEKMPRPVAIGSIERADQEEAIGSWLETHGVANAWQLASSLVDAGCTMDDLHQLSERFDRETLSDVVARLAASFAITGLVNHIESGTARMTELVRAIKQYSYMDQAAEQEFDIHEGLENTLLMFRSRLKHGIDVVREYDRSVPKICGHGGELNQVWTNLIDNAIDAMNGTGSLIIRTASEFGQVLVEIQDSGPGIPAEIRDRIFEPFFTTKAVGEGTGLGLDTVYRIVRKHRGDVKVESQPGRTTFQVRIPAASART